MRYQAGINASPVKKEAIFVSNSDSSDSDADLTCAARRTSHVQKEQKLEKPLTLKRSSEDTMQQQRRAGTSESIRRFHESAPATTSRGELSHVILRRIDLSNPEFKKPQPNRDQDGHTNRTEFMPKPKETESEKTQRLLKIRNSRKRNENKGSGTSSSNARAADRDVEMANRISFDENELQDVLQDYITKNAQPLTNASQRPRDMESEARRKQESRDRAQRKNERGRAIPVSKSFNAPRRLLPQRSKKTVEKYEPPVDFGSSSDDDDADESSDEREWDVEEIRGHRLFNGVPQFEVKWTGYDSDENTWEPEKNLENAAKVLEQYRENFMGPHTAPTAPMMR